MSKNGATAALAQLVAARVEAARRSAAVEAEARRASQAVAGAREALVAHERRGGQAEERARLEAELHEAQELLREPWAERLAGAEARVRDAHREVAGYAQQHLDELVASVERSGEAAAAALTQHARGIEAAYLSWQQTAGELGGLLALVAQPRPGDVTRCRPQTDRLAAAARELLQAGEQQGPRVAPDARAFGAPAAEQAVPA